MNDSTESQNPAFAQAAGYATVWRRPMCGECPLFFIRESDLSAGDMFAWCRLHRDRRHHECPACVDMDAHLAEVRRLRVSASPREEIIEECAKAVETQVRGSRYQWLNDSMFARLVGESAQRVRALKSRNDQLSGRAQEGEPNA